MDSQCNECKFYVCNMLIFNGLSYDYDKVQIPPQLN